jgi:effector-binding domain-containing protein
VRQSRGVLGTRPRRIVLNSNRGDKPRDGVENAGSQMETLMLFRFPLWIAMLALAAILAEPQPSWAQSSAPSPTPPAPAAKPDAPPAAPAAPAPGTASEKDPFGEDTTLTAKPIVYVKGTGNWDNAYETITGSLKTLKAYVDKAGLKTDGEPMTIFTATDDTGFQYQAAIPVTEPPKTPPQGGIAVGVSPEGHALKFVHRGSYDGLDNTYEAITNYLDERRLEAKDMFIEQYVTDPLSTNEERLVVNVLVLVK